MTKAEFVISEAHTDTILVRLTPEHVRFVADYEKRILQTNTLQRANYTQVNAPQRYYVGELGSLAVVCYLLENNIKFKYEPKADGYSDKCDITVYVKNTPKLIDVKTGSKPTYRKTMMPEAQFLANTPKDVYIGCLWVDGDRTIRICGCLSRKQFVQKSLLVSEGRKELTREVDFKDMYSPFLMSRLFDKID